MSIQIRPLSILCIAAASLWPFSAARGQTLTFTLEEQLIIGDDEDASAEYLFAGPKVVQTDSRGHIYVSDLRRADVRVFDGSGRYLSTIGKRGEGPGEFSEIFSMHVDDLDRLIIADRTNQRFTIFEDLGAKLETKPFPDGSWAEPHPILSVEAGFVLKYVRSYDDSEGPLPYVKDTKTLHQYDSALNHTEAFADLSGLFDLSVPFERQYSDNSSALKMASNGIDTIVLVPEVYSGQVYRYVHEGDKWRMEVLDGGPVPQNSCLSISRKDYDNNWELQRSSISSAGPSGVHFARIFNWSLGVVLLSTGEIVNFTKQTPLRGELGHQAEMFDAAGNLLGYGPIRFGDPALNSNEDIMDGLEILWVDRDDRVYLSRPNEHGFYVLSIADLVIERE